jgi:hypothetical protein
MAESANDCGGRLDDAQGFKTAGLNPPRCGGWPYVWSPQDA